MDWLTVIVMGVGLAMDCCTVSIVQGLNHRQWTTKAVYMSVLFGLFHVVMPIIGYYCGTIFVDFMSMYAPWIALILLGVLGIKMIYESNHYNSNANTVSWRLGSLFVLAFATSIDVLTTGVLFVPYPNWLWHAVLTIGIITTILSLSGYIIGAFVSKININMERIGGVLLILLGIKIWFEGVILPLIR